MFEFYLYSYLYFFIKIFISLLVINLIIISHELGHFYAALLFGIKPVEIAAGFGRILLEYKDINNTFWRLRAWPFGGYVDLFSNNKNNNLIYEHLGYFKKTAILLAGIFVNILLAIILFSLAYMIGYEDKKMIIGHVEKESYADIVGIKENDKILSLNDTKIASWENLQLNLIIMQSRNTKIRMSVLRGDSEFNIDLNSKKWPLFSKEKSLFEVIGFTSISEKWPIKVTVVENNTPAKEQGIKPGDEIIALNGKKIISGRRFFNYILKNPGKKIKLQIEREGVIIDKDIKIQRKGFIPKGYLGIKTQPTVKDPSLYRLNKKTFFSAVYDACVLTYLYLIANFVIMFYLVTGQLGLQVLSGPVFIISTTSQVVSYGVLTMLLRFSGVINIALAFLNILPIPLLDGGNWLFLTIETIIGRKLNSKARIWIESITFGFIIALLVTITIQDLARIFIK